jgi:hypothetical protein
MKLSGRRPESVVGRSMQTLRGQRAVSLRLGRA